MFVRVLFSATPTDLPHAVALEIDDAPRVTVREVLDALSLPPGSATIDGQRVQPAADALDVIADGAVVVGGHDPPDRGGAARVVAVVAGPDAGRLTDASPVPLCVGRDAASSVVIADRTVSRRHLEIDVTGTVACVRDLDSRNGSLVERAWLEAVAVVEPDSLVHLGRSSLRVADGSSCRSPRLPIRRARITLVRPPRARRSDEAPVAPPSTAGTDARRLTIDPAAILVPLLFAIVMAVAFDPRFALMGAAGPLVATLNHLVQRRRARRDDARRVVAIRAEQSRFRDDLTRGRTAHRRELRMRAPDLGEIARRIHHDPTLLWERRADHDDFLSLTVGFGAIDWTPRLQGDGRDLDAATRALLDEHRRIDDAPIAVDARTPVGIRGDADGAFALARALVVQAAALHGPADLRLVVATTANRCADWKWTCWLPHTHDARADIRLVTGDDTALRDAVEHLLGAADGDEVAHTVVVVDDASLVADRTMPIRQLLVGLRAASAIVLASPSAPLPALCQTVVDVDPHMVLTVSYPTGATLRDVRGAGVSHDTATRSAARLARFADPESAAPAVPLPSHVGLRSLLTAADGELVIRERWAASRDAASFVVPIGVDCEGPLLIDLVHDGPHALVAGTTGSGKSELLRTLITSLAATVDAERVNFLLVDYKGGSAFDRCAALPHTVGVVTDLDARLTARALSCLDAELRRREHALRSAGVDDLAQYHRRLGDGLAPLPRLVIVVDEFAALVADLPRFVDSLIDVGQRGRSLGVHVILATQRPSGVVNDALRANTNLRISLRVLDQSDSRDVLGGPAAALLGRRQPGRAIARLGAAELVTFQTASVTGCTPPRPATRVRLAEPALEHTESGQTRSDLCVLVDTIVDAHREAGFGPARRPWPDPLPERVTLEQLDSLGSRGTLEVNGAGTADRTVVFAIADEPREQRQVLARWWPSRGPLLVHSLRGGGATTTLATIAIDLARSNPPDRTHLYVLDLGAGDLAPVAGLPHCGAYVTAAETERISRLLRWATGEVQHRRALSPAVRAARPTTVIVVDNVAGLPPGDDPDSPRDALRRLIGDGAAVDVHLALSTDRAGALGHTSDALIAQRVSLRLAEPADYSMIGVRGVDPAKLPPGRGFLTPGATEIQVALPDRRGFAAAVASVAARGGARTAPPVSVLPHTVSLAALETAPAGPPRTGWVIGMLDRTLGPATLTLTPGDHALITGPARSGKSSALAIVARAARCDGAVVHLVAPARSPLARDLGSHRALTLDRLGGIVDDLSASADQCDGPRHVIVVDDADLIDEGGHLERLLATRPLHVHVIAAARADRLRAAFRHWTAEVRRSRIGVLLRPDDSDGELLGVRLPRIGTFPPITGRGYLVTDHGIDLVQVAHDDHPDDRSRQGR